MSNSMRTINIEDILKTIANATDFDIWYKKIEGSKDDYNLFYNEVANFYSALKTGKEPYILDEKYCNHKNERQFFRQKKYLLCNYDESEKVSGIEKCFRKTLLAYAPNFSYKSGKFYNFVLKIDDISSSRASIEFRKLADYIIILVGEPPEKIRNAEMAIELKINKEEYVSKGQVGVNQTIRVKELVESFIKNYTDENRGKPFNDYKKYRPKVSLRYYNRTNIRNN